MKIAVCINQVPDTASRITVSADGSGIEKNGVNYVINPYDEFALEEGLKLKENYGGEVVTFSVGDDSFQANIRKALAIGADKSVLIKGAAHDGFGVAMLLKEAISTHFGGVPDIILLGKESTDSNHSQVGPILGELFGIAAISVAVKMETDGTTATIWREIEGGTEVIDVAFPFLLTAQKGLNLPRVPNMKGIMAAKTKPLTPVEMSSPEAKSTVIKLERPPQKAPGKMLSSAAELVNALRHDAKVI